MMFYFDLLFGCFGPFGLKEAKAGVWSIKSVLVSSHICSTYIFLILLYSTVLSLCGGDINRTTVLVVLVSSLLLGCNN